MTIRYLADMHFDHDSIIAYDNRPFDSVEEMNEALIANWNQVVTDPEDLTWILGDFCFRDGERWNELLPEVPLYSNIYISVYPDWLQGYEQDSYWDFNQAILYANIAE